MTWQLIAADCVEAMRGMEPSSIDAVVTDPPYGLEFMGKEWDSFKATGVFPGGGAAGSIHNSPRTVESPRLVAGRPAQEFHQTWAAEALRVLKPGGHLLSFGGTRTYHRLVCALEDAGFEIRDCLAWLYGSGFPKSLDVSKAIDKARGDGCLHVTAFLREHRRRDGLGLVPIARALGFPATAGTHGTSAFFSDDPRLARVPTMEQWETLRGLLRFGDEMDAEVRRLNERKGKPSDEYASRPDADYPTTPGMKQSWTDGRGWNGNLAKGGDPVRADAERWQGWGTALKPAFEPIVLARKPLSGTVAENVLRHGVGALNVDGTRIGTEDVLHREGPDAFAKWSVDSGGQKTHHQYGKRKPPKDEPVGRWPANVLLDADAAAALDEQTAELHRRGNQLPERQGSTPGQNVYGKYPNRTTDAMDYADSGGASRFFYTAKTSRSERENGVREYGGIEEQQNASTSTHSNGQGTTRMGNQRERAEGITAVPMQNIRNNHPTVKPVDLMQWLCRLITPPQGVILDPFTGSGSTGIAALREGFSFIGIEREPDYVEIARARIIGDAPLFNVGAEA